MGGKPRRTYVRAHDGINVSGDKWVVFRELAEDDPTPGFRMGITKARYQRLKGNRHRMTLVIEYVDEEPKNGPCAVCGHDFNSHGHNDPERKCRIGRTDTSTNYKTVRCACAGYEDSAARE